MSTNFNTFSVSKGHYDLAHPQDWQTSIYFRLRDDAPMEQKRWHFTHNIDYAEPEEYEGLTVLEAAALCKTCIDRYWYSSSQKTIAALVDYLETTDIADQIAALMHELELLDKRRKEIEGKLEDLKEQQS